MTTLVDHLNLYVLAVIPDPYNPQEVEAVLDPATVLASRQVWQWTQLGNRLRPEYVQPRR